MTILLPVPTGVLGIDRIALAHLTVEDDRAGSLVPDLDAELVDPTSARELSVNDG